MAVFTNTVVLACFTSFLIDRIKTAPSSLNFSEKESDQKSLYSGTEVISFGVRQIEVIFG